MREKRKFKFGLLGLGAVGSEVIRQNLKLLQAKFYWIGDSRCFVSRTGRDPFTAREMHRLLQIKAQYPDQFAEKCRSELDSCDVIDFRDADKQVVIMQEALIAETKENWIVVDVTVTPANVGQALVQSALGCAGYCSANKTPWMDYALCSGLYGNAERKRTLLGLNCVVGVWVDQMEILPILMRKLRSGQITITKRDNSSLNLFFEKIRRGLPADNALAEIAAAGHLEPGANISLEIRDQVNKAKIAANICGILRGVEPMTSENSLTPKNLDTCFRDASEIADWHLSGRKRGTYPTLVTEINVNANENEISCSVGFNELASNHPLAKDFGAKNAISIQVSEDAQFDWLGKTKSKSGSGLFAYSGYGGASKTAAKLLWEAKRAIALINSHPRLQFSPLPVLWGLSSQPEAKRLERKLAATFPSNSTSDSNRQQQ